MSDADPGHRSRQRGNNGRHQQRKAQQLIDHRMVQAFALGDLAAADHYAVVEQLLLVESPRQLHPQGLVVLPEAST